MRWERFRWRNGGWGGPGAVRKVGSLYHLLLFVKANIILGIIGLLGLGGIILYHDVWEMGRKEGKSCINYYCSSKLTLYYRS